MHEELYEKLSRPMLEAYLKRIGIDIDNGLPEPTVSTLDALIYAHQCSVPFETLDSSDLGLDVSLATAQLFDKIVTRRRGGYCFELNGLFDKLLQALGFATHSFLARAIINRDYLPPQLHRIPLVEYEGKLCIADVGFGGPVPTSSLLLVEGVQPDSIGERFRLTQDAEGWWLLERHLEDGWQKLLLFSAQRQLDVDFVTPNYYCAHAPESFFVINRIVSLRTPSGAIRLFNNSLKHTEGDVTTETTIEGHEELRETLSTNFNITNAL
jgi:N-hydroxyarylamine O-acetyltransferase